MNIRFNGTQKAILWTAAIFGFIFVNGVFIRDFIALEFNMKAALYPGIQMVFVVEALMLVVLFSYLIYSYKLEKPGWLLFIILSIAGSLVFAIPFSLLMWERANRKKGSED